MGALFLAIGGWMAGTIVAAGAWDPVRDASITSTTRPLDAGGQSVAVFTDVLQPERQVTCRSTNEDEKETTPIPPAGYDLTVDDDGNQWYLIGFELKGRDAMTISCTPRDKRSDNATYAYSVVDGFAARTKTGNAIAITGTVAGIGLAIWTFIARRRRDHQETDDAST